MCVFCKVSESLFFRFIYPFYLVPMVVFAPPLSSVFQRFATSSQVPQAAACSLNDNIEELVPVCRLKTGQAHGETLDFFYYVVLDVKVFDPAFV